MESGSLARKIFGSQHRYDKNVEILNGFHPKGRLLDAAARHGRISLKLKASGFDVVAADIHPIDFPSQEIPILIADFNQLLPFKEATFDFILCSNGIEYLEDPYGFVRECYRILKADGKLLIETPNALNLQSRMANLAVGFYRFNGRPYDEVSDRLDGEHRMNLQNYYQLRFNLHRNGFRIIQVTAHEFSNRAMAFSFIYPFVYLATLWASKREKRPLQRERNREIFKHVMSADVAFGKQLFVLAEKNPSYLKGI
ncbi:MAG: class I SAM-dependent methyltransferase [Deltaproteobacteria bacterium]|nr:class I SAM-dependent methyltransferase [Deltaproteobacteria bacterium]MBM4324509.1 class I SAM-dependent methyltransferase [Deltaproteobacteria bacterium]